MISIGIDIGGTSIKGAGVTDKGQILEKFSMPVYKDDTSEITLERLGKTVKEYLDSLKELRNEVVGIGVGCPGAIDSEKGIVNYSNNLQWSNVHLKDYLEKVTKLPVRITNDANAATLGEAKFGSGKIYKSIIMITLGTGVGGGVIIDGKLFEGNEGKGTELGHTVIVVDGEPCSCGRNGCLEAYSSATALIRETKRMMEKNPNSYLWQLVDGDISKVNGKVAFDAAKNGDKVGHEIVKWYVKYLSEGILNFCNIFRPDVIILSGGIANQGDYLINRLVEYCKARYYGYQRAPEVAIKKAILGYESGIIGAGCLFL